MISSRSAVSRSARSVPSTTRLFSTSRSHRVLRDISELPDRHQAAFKHTRNQQLLALQWPAPPRNIFLVKKDKSADVTEKFVEFARHIHAEYPSTAIILEPQAAAQLHDAFAFSVYSLPPDEKGNEDSHKHYHQKVDLISTLGGDGTILHASSLFAKSPSVPPILSFSMGTLGFLGEWKFSDYKRAFRETYMSGADVPHPQLGGSSDAWAGIRGKSMGSLRNTRVLVRSRLKVGVFDPDGRQIDGENQPVDSNGRYAMNEVIIHRGRDPHLAIVEIFVGGRFFTEAVADGMIISTPTGSTAYSLSSGGSIVHPLVSSLLLTPICPRSLSFRPLVLPANTPITLRLSEKNRGRDVEVSIDGVRRDLGLGVGMELRVSGEQVQDPRGNWQGGVPSIVRGQTDGEVGGSEDSWVGGLNALLKFNYAFGEE